MENQDNIIMSRIAFERVQAKEERDNRFKNILLLVLVILVFLSNALWLYVWNSYDYYTETVEIDTGSENGGDANYIGSDGDIYNGTAEP